MTVRLTLSVALPTGGTTDVLVDADELAPVGALVAELSRATSVPPGRLHVGSTPLEDDQNLLDSGLLDGALVGMGQPAADDAAVPTRGWQLHVVAGPATGTVLALPLGAHELGRSTAVCFDDDLMSRRHARLEVSSSGATLVDLGSRNGTTLDGQPVGADPVEVRPGQVLRLGDTLLTVRAAQTPDATTEPADPGWLSFLRPPRMLPHQPPVTIVLPDAPQPPTRRRFPLVTLLLPLALGVVMALVVGSPLYLLFALASPVMMLGNVVGDRRSGSKDYRAATEEYTVALAAAQRRLDAAVVQEQQQRREGLLDAPQTLLTCQLPGRRLWERRRHDDDALVLRVGVADLPSSITVERGHRAPGAEPDDPHLLHAVPVAVPLREVGVLGVCGPDAPRAALLRWLVVQLAAAHAPRDLSLTLLTGRDADHWAWLSRLPHARPRELEGPCVSLGNDADTVAARVAELAALVAARKEVARTAGRVTPDHFAAHVVVLDGARALRGTPGLAQLLEDGPEVAVYALCADAEERLLPETCTATLLLGSTGPQHLDLLRTGAPRLTDVLAEGVTRAWAEQVGRAMSPLRDVSSDESAATLPDSARLLDVLNLEPPTVDGVGARWLLEGRTTSMVIGAGLDGPFSLDLRRDGPHGLIAGTTGSGKSELLQTIIASLAVANRPDAMNFVLVDYKGGSAFKDCAYLPHTVGMVTDLDNHLVERALTSLGAELKHREHFLADAGVKDIEDYLDLQAKEPHRPSLPRLLIVIDEFASLARELPDFVTGLVSIAQRGRSLGIHLLLATQRPSGVVSPEIRANTNLRISLRVTDAADSTDVLESPEAARLPKSAPGRGFARLGAGALVPFQAGRVGGRRPGAVATHVPPPFVVPLRWAHLGYAAPVATRSAVKDDVEVTDLSVLVSVLRDAAAAAAVPPQRSPWLDALPTELLLDAVPAGTGFAFGLTDVPAAQQRRTADFDPARDGHLLVLGSARSGRSQLLRTLAASIGRAASAADLHLYALDCGNGALQPLVDLPHCGAVVTRTQPDRAARLLTRLQQEMDRRQQVLAEGGYADITEQRRGSGAALPHLVLLLDRWEGFTSTLGELDGGRLTETVMAILREGASVGVHAVLTGDRSLASGRISALTENKLALRLADRGDYSLIGLNPKSVPERVPSGRAFASGSGLETQVALLTADDSGQAQAAVLAQVAAEATARDADLPRSARPFRVDVLPSRIGFEAAWQLVPGAVPTPFALVGVGGDDLQGLGCDFAGGPTFIVAGPNRSGRSTLLAVMARSLVRSGAQVLLVAPRPGALRELEGQAGVLALVTDANEAAETYEKALAASAGPVVLLIDDGEGLRDVPAADLFREIVKGAQPGVSLVLGGNAEGICTGLSGWQVEAKKSRQGVLLSPQGISDGDLVGVRLPRSAIGQPVTPGRGWLHLGDSQVTSIAVPLADGLG